MSSKTILALGLMMLAAAGGGSSVYAESVVKTAIFSDSNPVEIIVNPVTNRYYVIINGGVEIVDGRTMTLSGNKLGVSGTPQHGAINTNPNRVDVASQGSNLAIINGDTGTAQPELN